MMTDYTDDTKDQDLNETKIINRKFRSYRTLLGWNG